MAARLRTEHGPDQVGALYEALGARIFDTKRTEPDRPADQGSRAFVAPVLAELGLDACLADALDDTSLDIELRRESDEALRLTGKDVGTPIIHFSPPEGTAFFGPVISRLPSKATPVACGTMRLAWLASPGSQNSNAACANGHS